MSIPPEVFEQRRRTFMEAIGPDAAAVVFAAPEAVRSHDVEHRYRQDSDFLYLTGFPEPDAVCLLLPGHAKEEYVLFVRPRDQERETWTGRRAGVEGAVEGYGAAMAYPIDQLATKVPEHIAARECLYHAIGRNHTWNERVLEWLERAIAARPRTGSGPTALLDPRKILHEMRLRKGPEELECMRRAAAITVEAHREAMRAARPGMREFEIEALVDYGFRRAGAAGTAYPSIVAAGENATILHYTANDAALGEGDLLLVDAGAEVAGYCADVTRTFPVGEKFEGRGRTLYEIVLEAQKAAIERVRPGVRVEEVHRAALEVLVDGLLQIGLLSGSRDEILEKELYRPFYMHRTSHWLGLDVHDAGNYRVDGESRALEPGMVLTVEPGLYVGAHVEDVGPEWMGRGVRIEDDVLVTENGHEVLTTGAAKEVAEIEALRGERAFMGR